MKRKKSVNKGNSKINTRNVNKNKKGQQILGLSFGVIFSIFLIIFFTVIAFIVIKNFLSAQQCAQLGIFIDKFKSDVKKTWNSQIDSHKFKGVLPSKIKKVCFSDLTQTYKGPNTNTADDFRLYEGRSNNLFIYPIGSSCELPAHNIPHIDLENIISSENPYCIDVNDGIIEIIIEKGLIDRLVKIARI